MPLYNHCTPTFGIFANPFAKCDEVSNEELAKDLFDRAMSSIEKKYPDATACYNSCSSKMPDMAGFQEIGKACGGKQPKGGGTPECQKAVLDHLGPVMTCMKDTKECACVSQTLKDGMGDLTNQDFSSFLTKFDKNCAKK